MLCDVDSCRFGFGLRTSFVSHLDFRDYAKQPSHRDYDGICMEKANRAFRFVASFITTDMEMDWMSSHNFMCS